MLDIASYTQENWGHTQMMKYLDALEQCLLRLAENPKLGRPCEGVRPDLRRFEKAQHVVFFRQKEYGIRVLRILHHSMNAARHEFEDESPDSSELN